MIEAVTFHNNQTHKPEVYNDRPDLDAYTLTITSDAPLPMAGEGSDDPTRIEVKFPTSIFDIGAISAIRVTTDGWQHQTNGPWLMLTCIQDAPRPAKELEIGLTGVTSSKTAAQDDLLVKILVDGRAYFPAMEPRIFLMRYPSGGKDLTRSLKVSLSPADGADGIVYYTPEGLSKIENTLFLTLTNKNPDESLVKDPWDRGAPTISASFVYGDDTGSLTPADKPASDPYSAWNIQVDLEEAYLKQELQLQSTTHEWTVSDPDPGGASKTPVWTLQPVPENKQVLGPKSGANVTFRISMIATQAPEGHTQLYLQYCNFPGYDDGYFTLVLHKTTPRQGIRYFNIYPASIDYGNSTTLTWDTQFIEKVELNDGKTSDSVNSKGEKKITPKQDTVYTLYAYNKKYDAEPQHDHQQRVTVIQPEPEIKAFTINPNLMICGHPFLAVGPDEEAGTIKWETHHADIITFTSSTTDPGIPSANFKASGSTPITIHRASSPQEITMKAYSSASRQATTETINIFTEEYTATGLFYNTWPEGCVLLMAVGILCENLPIGAEVSFSASKPNPEGADLEWPKTRIVQSPQNIGFNTNIKGGYRTDVTVTVFLNGKTPVDGMSVRLFEDVLSFQGDCD